MDNFEKYLEQINNTVSESDFNKSRKNLETNLLKQILQEKTKPNPLMILVSTLALFSFGFITVIIITLGNKNLTPTNIDTTSHEIDKILSDLDKEIDAMTKEIDSIDFSQIEN